MEIIIFLKNIIETVLDDFCNQEIPVCVSFKKKRHQPFTLVQEVWRSKSSVGTIILRLISLIFYLFDNLKMSCYARTDYPNFSHSSDFLYLHKKIKNQTYRPLFRE